MWAFKSVLSIQGSCGLDDFPAKGRDGATFLLIIFHLQDMMDDICQEQFLELSYLNGVPEPSRGRGVPVRGRGAAPPPPPVPR